MTFFGTNLIGQEQWARRGEDDARIAANTMPVGAITAYWGTTSPAGWLICDGGTFSDTTYPALAALLGGTTLPNLKGRVIVGINSADTDFDVLGDIGGSKTSTAPHTHSHDHGQLGAVNTGGQSQDHYHKGGGPSDYILVSPQTPNGSANVTTGGGGHGIAGSTHWNNQDHVHGHDHKHAADAAASSAGATSGNLPPFIALNYLIKAA